MSIMFLPLRLVPVAAQCVVLSTVLGLVFSRDERLKPLLQQLEGKVFRIHVRDTGAVMFLGFARGRPWVHPECKERPDVKIDGSLEGFARMCFAHEDPDQLVFAKLLRVTGDSEVMLRFKKLLAEADLDWERELRAAFGDLFGGRVARAAKALVALEQKAERQSRELAEGCLREIGLPDQERLQSWQAGVEQLAHRLSRLKGRVTRLEHRLQTQQDEGSR